MPFDLVAAAPSAALVAVLALALVGLGLAVAAVRRAAHGTELARLPLAAHQDVRLDAAGPVVLHGEGPHFTRRFGGLDFRLVDRTTGQIVPARRLWMRTTTAGWARVRLTLRGFEVARAGIFRLEVTGLPPSRGPAAEEGALVFLPPAGVRLPLAILTCVVAGAAAVGATVALGWRVFGVAAPPAATTTVTDAVPPAPAPPALARGGRQLRSDPAPSAPTRTVRWSGAGLTLAVPATWQTRADGPELDVRDPDRPSTYLVGHVVTFPPPTSADLLARAVIDGAAERLASGLVAGFTGVRWGGVDGLVTIETRDDGAAAMAVWSGYRPTPKGVANVTLLFGADAATFARLEPAAQAALASARFD